MILFLFYTSLFWQMLHNWSLLSFFTQGKQALSPSEQHMAATFLLI